MTAGAVGTVVLQVIVSVVLAPLVAGVLRQTRARLEGRAGAGVAQPWRDLRKLFAKEPMRAAGGGPLLVATPLVLVGSSLLLCALVPLVVLRALPSVPDDLFVVVSVLLVGTVMVALLGLESGTAFGGMGSSRHMMISALVEPTVLVAVYALSIPVGTSALSAIVQARLDRPASVVSPVGLLAVVALGLATIAETGRLPVDNPDTHLELTMVHEGPLLEYAGRDLAYLQWAMAARHWVVLVIGAQVFVPHPPGVWAQLATLPVALAVLCAGLALTETMVAKMRILRVPRYLAAGALLAGLGLTAGLTGLA